MVSKEQHIFYLFYLFNYLNWTKAIGNIFWASFGHFFYTVLVLDHIQRNVLSTHKRPLNMWCAIILENR